MNEHFISNKEVFLAIPTRDGWIRHELMMSVMYWQSRVLLYMISGIEPTAWARNACVEEFLKTDCRYLWFIDSDTVPSPSALDGLLLYTGEADIVTGITPIRKMDSDGELKVIPNTLIWDAKKDGYVPHFESGFIDACGAACMLIKREVIESIDAPWFKQDMQRRDEDFRFCEEARENGYQIFSNFDVQCAHYREIAL